MENVILVCCGFGLFVALCSLLRGDKVVDLIAGYHRMPREEREKYDPRKILRCVRGMLFLLLLSIVTVLASGILRMTWLHTVGMLAMIGGPVAMMVYANTGNHFRKE